MGDFDHFDMELQAIFEYNSLMEILPSTRQTILLDTDIGNDIDDVLALAMLCRLHRSKVIRLMGVSISNGCQESAYYVSTMLKLFDIAVPIYHNFETKKGDPQRYLNIYRNYEQGKHLPIHTTADDFFSTTFVKDTKVRIIGIGSATNICKAVEFLFRTNKIGLLESITVMAGNFQWKKSEFNIMSDPAAFAKLISFTLPQHLYFCDYNVGKRIYFDGSIFEEPHPFRHGTVEQMIRDSYVSFREMPYDRPMWDPCTVLFALRDNYANLFNETPITYEFDCHDTIVRIDPNGTYKAILASVKTGASRALKNTIYHLSLGLGPC